MFEESLKGFAGRIEDLKNVISTEEATKTSLVMPFFQILGYDVFNPAEFTPEFNADVGIKKGEKVDYAIILNGKPAILVEVKPLVDKLARHDSQLYRYFSVTKAKFAILTNGQHYKFFTDLDEKNKMDDKPFLEINLSKLKEAQINELKKFHKDNFDVDDISDTASELKYMGLIKLLLKDEFTDPSDEFIRFILGSGVYHGQKNQNVVDRFKPMIKKTINNHINEIVNERIQNAIKADEAPEDEEKVEAVIEEVNLIETTEEELEAYYIVKAILGNSIDSSRIYYKDTRSYFNILLDDKVTRWICRIFIRGTGNYVIIPEGDDLIRHDLDSMNDLYNLSSELIVRAQEIDH